MFSSAQTMSKNKLETFFPPSLFPLILGSHKQWHLSSLAFVFYYSPTDALSHLSPLEGSFLFHFAKLCLGELSLPEISAVTFENIFRLLCHKGLHPAKGRCQCEQSPKLWNVCVTAWGLACTLGLRMGMWLRASVSHSTSNCSDVPSTVAIAPSYLAYGKKRCF